ncbi:uncharacterized protein LOC132393827 isoform X1 [Hypanus sabinus]|uniref:uncharacterized protein LOC132393827 isoform X1 n=1 Tax=Hypanus sabinus TaxID=79690 RepID=UPI0028C3914A|nr:uncharacterized protein LOC132393827 isoform X1 [Hypanus sabinus]
MESLVSIVGIRRTMTWNAFVCSLFLFSGMRLFPATTTSGIIEQSPVQITVTEGETVQLNCTYISKTNDAKKLVGAITWYKDKENHTVYNKSGEFQGRVRPNSSKGILSQHLQIFNVRMNDTGKYYCKVEIFGEGNHLGKGTEVQVTRKQHPPSRTQAVQVMVSSPCCHQEGAAVGHDNGLFTNERKIVLYVSPLLVIVLLALTLLISIIYRKRCARSTGGIDGFVAKFAKDTKVSGAEDSFEEADKRSANQVVPKKEESVLYAEMNIRKVPWNRRSDYAACESGQTGPSSQAGTGEDRILYAEVTANSWATTKPKKSPRRENEQVVYAAVNMQRM